MAWGELADARPLGIRVRTNVPRLPLFVPESDGLTSRVLGPEQSRRRVTDRPFKNIRFRLRRLFTRC